MAKRVVLQKKNGLVLNIFSSIGFIALGYFMYINSEGSIIEFWSEWIALIGICFFSVILLINIFKLFKVKAGLEIDDEGFTYSSSAFTAGEIKWSSVQDISFNSENQLVIVALKDNSSYVKSFKGWKSKIMERNIEKYGSPVLIYSESLSMEMEEVFAILAEAFQYYKGK